jgi:outer membrane protein
MQKLTTLLALPFSLLLALSALPAAAQSEARIGFVNTERILRESAPAIRAQKKIEAEFAKRDQELAKTADQLKHMQEELERQGLTMSEGQRRTKQREFNDLNRDFQRRQRELREDLNQRRNEEIAQVIENARRLIRQIAEQEKYDVILQDAVYVNPRVDITDRVIKALEGKPPAR